MSQVAVTTQSPIRSTVGKKALMAVSGAALVLFLVAHMLGNLKIFVGATSFDSYAHWLREIGTPVLPATGYLWLQRAGLTLALVVHIWAATSLALAARRARPVRYAHRPRGRQWAQRSGAHGQAAPHHQAPYRRTRNQGGYAARTMRWGGVIIGLFVVYHVLDLTTGQLNPIGDPARPYANVVADFAPRRWYITLVYVLGVVAVGFHLRHGLFSAARSLGQQTPRGERRARTLALVFAVALTAGYLLVPFAVLTGLVR